MNATETCRIVVAIHTTGIAAYRAADSRDGEPYAPIAHRRAIKMDADAGNGPDKPDTPPEKRKKLPVYNGNAIGVDLCEDKLVYDSQHKSVSDRDWYFDEVTEATGAKLVASIMRRYSIDLDHVVRHYDVTGKWCPRPFVGQALIPQDAEKWYIRTTTRTAIKTGRFVNGASGQTASKSNDCYDSIIIHICVPCMQFALIIK